MPHCWKSHATAQIYFLLTSLLVIEFIEEIHSKTYRTIKQEGNGTESEYMPDLVGEAGEGER